MEKRKSDFLRKIKEYFRQTISEEKQRGTLFSAISFWVITISFIIYCLSVLIPLVWMLYSSLKTETEYISNIMGLPKKLYWKNYSLVFDNLKIIRYTTQGMVQMNFFNMFLTSVIFSVSSAVWPVLWQTLCAYVISSINFHGKKFWFNLGLFLMIFPSFSSGAVGLKVYKMLGIYDNMAAMIFIGAQGTFYGTYFLILHAGFKGISNAYVEAAYIDGASKLYAFIKIVLPMILPTSLCLMLLIFLSVWSDYSTFIFMLPSYANLAYGMYMFQQNSSKFGATQTSILAGFVICMIPSILLYLLAQKYTLNKYVVGGLKG